MAISDYAIWDVAIWESSPTTSEVLDTISFDDYWIQNNRIIIIWEWFSLRNMTNRDVSITASPISDWSIFNSSFFRWNSQTLSWYLVWTSKTDLDDLIDEFKLKMSKENKLLKWRVNWKIRQRRATVSDLSFWNKENIIIPFSITFTTQDSFWSDETEQSLPLWIVTTSPRVDQIYNTWNKSFLYISMWFWSWISWTDTISIKVWWIWITINQTINDWDILIIDWIEKQVLLNWTEIDFDDIFPLLEIWSNTVTIEINWTFNVDISLIYKLNLL